MVLFLMVLFIGTQPFRATGDEFFGEFATQPRNIGMSVDHFLAVYVGVMVRTTVPGCEGEIWAC
jgi:hypothetical protein